VVLGRDQDQPRASRGRLRLWRAAEGCKDAKNGNVGGENAKSNGSDDGEAENDGHQDRNHESTNLKRRGLYQMHGSEIRIPTFEPPGDANLQFNLR
jgi:hypothetical protein